MNIKQRTTRSSGLAFRLVVWALLGVVFPGEAASWAADGTPYTVVQSYSNGLPRQMAVRTSPALVYELTYDDADRLLSIKLTSTGQVWNVIAQADGRIYGYVGSDNVLREVTVPSPMGPLSFRQTAQGVVLDVKSALLNGSFGPQGSRALLEELNGAAINQVGVGDEPEPSMTQSGRSMDLEGLPGTTVSDVPGIGINAFGEAVAALPMDAPAPASGAMEYGQVASLDPRNRYWMTVEQAGCNPKLWFLDMVGMKEGSQIKTADDLVDPRTDAARSATPYAIITLPDNGEPIMLNVNQLHTFCDSIRGASINQINSPYVIRSQARLAQGALQNQIMETVLQAGMVAISKGMVRPRVPPTTTARTPASAPVPRAALPPGPTGVLEVVITKPVTAKNSTAAGLYRTMQYEALNAGDFEPMAGYGTNKLFHDASRMVQRYTSIPEYRDFKYVNRWAKVGTRLRFDPRTGKPLGRSNSSATTEQIHAVAYYHPNGKIFIFEPKTITNPQVNPRYR